jgi:NAD(P)-dependent dehydrogenase (short-subunit alcohol dehydrogenase family)
MSYYKGKVAVITGAGSGIGRELACRLAAAGACRKAGAEVRTYIFDVSRREAFQAHVDEVRRNSGAAHLLFNNASVTLVSTVEHTTAEEVEFQLGTNLMGVTHGCKAFLPGMLAQREGVLVNVSSVFGWVAFPAQAFYNVSKFGVRTLTECLWQELEGTGGERAPQRHPHQHREGRPPRPERRRGRDEVRGIEPEDARHAARALRRGHPAGRGRRPAADPHGEPVPDPILAVEAAARPLSGDHPPACPDHPLPLERPMWTRIAELVGIQLHTCQKLIGRITAEAEDLPRAPRGPAHRPAFGLPSLELNHAQERS